MPWLSLPLLTYVVVPFKYWRLSEVLRWWPYQKWLYSYTQVSLFGSTFKLTFSYWEVLSTIVVTGRYACCQLWTPWTPFLGLFISWIENVNSCHRIAGDGLCKDFRAQLMFNKMWYQAWRIYCSRCETCGENTLLLDVWGMCIQWVLKGFPAMIHSSVAWYWLSSGRRWF